MAMQWSASIGIGRQFAVLVANGTCKDDEPRSPNSTGHVARIRAKCSCRYRALPRTNPGQAKDGKSRHRELTKNRLEPAPDGVACN